MLLPKKTLLRTVVIVLIFLSPFLKAETLEEAWNVALAQNYRLKAVKAETDGLNQELSAAEGQILPRVDVSAGYTHLNVTPAAKTTIGGQSAQFPMSQEGYWKTQAMLSVPVYTGGAIEHNINAANANLSAAQSKEMGTVHDLKMQVAENYIAVLRTEGALQVAQNHLDSLRSHKKDVDAMFKQGIVAKNDVLTAEVEVANAEQRLVQISNQLEIAKAQYNQLLNRELSAKVNLQHAIPKIPLGSLKEFNAQALNQRAEIVVLTEQIKALEQQAQGIKSALLPQVALNGGYQYQENKYQAHPGIWTVGVGLEWKLFDGSTRHKSEAVVRQALALQEQREDLLSMIGLQVRQAWLDMQETQKRVFVMQKAIEQARENLKVATDRYQQGLSTSTDLLKAEDLRRVTEDNLNNAHYDVALAVYRLKRAVGIL